MDNRTLDIQSEGDSALASAIRLSWPASLDGKASHYKIIALTEKVNYYGNPTNSHSITSCESKDGTPTLILLWGEENGSPPLPYPLGIDEAIPFAANWLKSVSYGQEPDHDGVNRKGWRVFTEAYGYVANHRYTIVAIQPVWAMYGK